MILVFGFKNSTCIRAIEAVRALNNPGIELRVIGSGTRIFREFAQEIANSNYDAVIGIGETRRGTHIRSEANCNNRFRRTLLAQAPATYTLPRHPVVEPIRDGNSIGNSYCNAVAYAVMHIARPKHFTYLHVPRAASPQLVVDYVALHMQATLWPVKLRKQCSLPLY